MSKFHFDLKALKMRRGIPGAVGEMAANAVYEYKVVAFDKRAWDGVPWAPIKNPRPGSRPLVKSGRMRESIRILRRSTYSAIVGSDVEYATYQNANRQFIGESRRLMAKNAATLKKLLRIK